MDNNINNINNNYNPVYFPYRHKSYIDDYVDQKILYFVVRGDVYGGKDIYEYFFKYEEALKFAETYTENCWEKVIHCVTKCPFYWNYYEGDGENFVMSIEFIEE